jgi:hypothetical protein
LQLIGMPAANPAETPTLWNPAETFEARRCTSIDCDGTSGTGGTVVSVIWFSAMLFR